MKLPRDVEPRALVHALGVMGYEPTRQTGSHIRITTHLGGELHQVIPDHGPIKIGTLHAILAGIAADHAITVDELLAKLQL